MSDQVTSAEEGAKGQTLAEARRCAEAEVRQRVESPDGRTFLYEGRPQDSLYGKLVNIVVAAEARASTAESEVSRLTERLAKVEAENARLIQRLEIDHAFDTAGNRIPFPEGMKRWDGIACRDETIKGLEENASALAERVASLEAVLGRAADTLNACSGILSTAGETPASMEAAIEEAAARAALKETRDE